MFFQEEEAEAQKAREEEAAAVEFEKWKGEFSVDDEGTLEEVQDSNQDLLANFVEYIKVTLCSVHMRFLLSLALFLINVKEVHVSVESLAWIFSLYKEFLFPS